MNCKESERYWQEYLDGTLRPELSCQLEEHINSCAQCSQELELWEGIRAQLRASRPEVSPDPHYFNRLWAKIEPRLRAPSLVEQLIAMVSWRRAAQAAVGLTLFLFGFLIASQFFTSAPPSLQPMPEFASSPIALVPSATSIPTLPPVEEPQGKPLIKSTVAREAEAATPLPSEGMAPAATPVTVVSGPEKSMMKEVSLAPPDIEQLKTLAQRMSHSQLLDSIQDLKLQLYQRGEGDYIPVLHQVEETLVELSRLSQDSKAPAEALSLYQEAELALLRKDYGEALNKYYQTASLAPGTYLELLARLQSANIEFDVLGDYKKALENYKSCLQFSALNYTPLEMRNHVLERVQLLEENKEDDWRPLRLFLQANASKPDLAFLSYKELFSTYPDSPLISKAIDQLRELTLMPSSLHYLYPQQVISLFQEMMGGSEELQRRVQLQFSIAELFNFALKDKRQALLEYTRLLEMSEEGSYAQLARQRLDTLSLLVNY